MLTTFLNLQEINMMLITMALLILYGNNFTSEYYMHSNFFRFSWMHKVMFTPNLLNPCLSAL